ncbi:Gustatory receptor 119g [Halyomorpha halys]|nr:Gustatory receptor 119g [Halyomorpha halys]
MAIVAPCQPTIGKVDDVLNEVFKLSRFIGTFPIDYEYSAISQLNLAKGIILYLPSGVMVVSLVYRIILQDDALLAHKVTYVLQSLPPILFCYMHVARLIRSKGLLNEIYNELKEIGYNLWKCGVCWFYKPHWCTKYLSLAVMLGSSLLWDIPDGTLCLEYLPFYIIDIAFITIMSEYAILVQVLTSILRSIKKVEESKTVVMLIDKLLTLSKKLNTLYEPQLVWYIVVVYLLILFTVFDLILAMKTIMGFPLISLMSLLFPIAQIIMNVGYFSQEVKKTNKMLYRRLLYNLDDETLQFHLVAKRDIVFTAGGFFILENTLICTMITTGINYLVFFLQYM